MEKVKIPVMDLNGEAYISADNLVKFLEGCKQGFTFSDQSEYTRDALIYVKDGIFDTLINEVKKMNELITEDN